MTTARHPNPNLLVHACERCGGDLYRDVLDEDGEDEVSYVCLQCGRRRSRVAGHDASPAQRERAAIRRLGHGPSRG